MRLSIQLLNVLLLLLVICYIPIDCKSAKPDDYYSILNVPRDASDSDIKKAYRKLAMKYHPDKNNAANAQSIFENVSSAYEILSDPEKRKLYDQYGHDAFNGNAAAQQQQQQHTHQQQPFGYNPFSGGSPHAQYTFSSSSGGGRSGSGFQFSDPMKLFQQFFGDSSSAGADLDPFADLFGGSSHRSARPNSYQQHPHTTKQRNKKQAQQPTKPTFTMYAVNKLTKQLYNSMPFDQCSLSIIMLPSSTSNIQSLRESAESMARSVIGTTKATYFVVDDNDVINALRNTFNIRNKQDAIVAYKGKHKRYSTQLIDHNDNIDIVAKSFIEKVSDGSIKFVVQKTDMSAVK